jgi:hypothetical protein
MRIKTTNPALRALYDEEIMGEHYDPPGVEFASTGTAQVLAEVGERVVEHYDDIEPLE